MIGGMTVHDDTRGFSIPRDRTLLALEQGLFSNIRMAICSAGGHMAIELRNADTTHSPKGVKVKDPPIIRIYLLCITLPMATHDKRKDHARHHNSFSSPQGSLSSLSSYNWVLSGPLSASPYERNC